MEDSMFVEHVSILRAADDTENMEFNIDMQSSIICHQLTN